MDNFSQRNSQKENRIIYLVLLVLGDWTEGVAVEDGVTVAFCAVSTL